MREESTTAVVSPRQLRETSADPFMWRVLQRHIIFATSAAKRFSRAHPTPTLI
jgi:hypothetical protein